VVNIQWDKLPDHIIAEIDRQCTGIDQQKENTKTQPLIKKKRCKESKPERKRRERQHKKGKKDKDRKKRKEVQIRRGADWVWAWPSWGRYWLSLKEKLIR
jgi:hypothetical protein